MRRLLLALVLTACASPEAHTGTVSSAIIGGSDSDDGQDATVLVMRYQGGDNGTLGGCSGVLITPKLVLTARHCVAETDETSVCSSEGTAVQGGKIHGNVPPEALYVFPGKSRPDLLNEGLSRAARGAEIIDDGGDTVCNHDMALILLQRPMDGVPVAPLRLYGKATEGDTITAVGWGYTDSESDPATRKQRADITVLAVGPLKDAGLGADEFITAEGTCQGDSGGPALASSGAVVGILSRGGNGTKDPPPDACHQAQNVYSALFGRADVIMDASHRSGYEPWLEGEPNPLAPRPAPAEESGCGVARGGKSSWPGPWLLALGLVFTLRRRALSSACSCAKRSASR
jgi:hypothetical protein